MGYVSGPVDSRRVHEAWSAGTHGSLFGTSYLTHWFAELTRQDRRGVVVTSHGEVPYREVTGAFTHINLPKPVSTGLTYHVEMARWLGKALSALESEGVRSCVLTDAQLYWFATKPFRDRGMRFINSYHCALRSLGHKRASPHEICLQLTSRRHLAHGDPTMVIAPYIAEQLAREPGADKRTILQLKPDYDRDLFEGFEEPLFEDDPESPVQVMFAGRVERNKGVFDMLEMNEMLAERTGRPVHFHIHGTGTHIDELRAAVAASRHGNRVTIHGFTAGTELARHYAASHIVIAPTRSEFEEGFAKSVVEGVLALRPVVTSVACPSIHTVGEACVEAEVDNPASYADAIWQLANRPELVKSKVDAARRLREMFFDPPERYDRQLRKALAIAEATT